MCPIIATVIKLSIVDTNTKGFKKLIGKPFKCLSGGKVELIFYNVLLCKIKPVLPGRLIVLYVPVACTVLHRGSEFARKSECIHCCWCGSSNTYTLGNTESMLISSYWPNLAVSTILSTITSELQVLCFVTLPSLCMQISHWCCCGELSEIRGVLIFISIMCSRE